MKNLEGEQDKYQRRMVATTLAPTPFTRLPWSGNSLCMSLDDSNISKTGTRLCTPIPLRPTRLSRSLPQVALLPRGQRDRSRHKNSIPGRLAPTPAMNITSASCHSQHKTRSGSGRLAFSEAWMTLLNGEFACCYPDHETAVLGKARVLWSSCCSGSPSRTLQRTTTEGW